MALNDVLSALRVLILDAPPIPKAVSARKELFQSKFPGLSANELDDLVAIDPDKLGIYTGTIFAGERSLLKNNFPITFFLLEQAWEQVRSEPFSGFEFVKSMHKKYPWLDKTTEGIVSNFVRYISNDCQDLCKTMPLLPEMARLELLTMEVRRKPLGTLALSGQLQIDSIRTLTVEELLNCTFVIPENVRFGRFEFNVLSARSEYYRNGVISEQEKHSTHLAIGRNKLHQARFVEIDAEIYRYLNDLERCTAFSLEELGEEFALTVSDNISEIEKFNVFLKLLVGLAESGVIVLFSHS